MCHYHIKSIFHLGKGVGDAGVWLQGFTYPKHVITEKQPQSYIIWSCDRIAFSEKISIMVKVSVFLKFFNLSLDEQFQVTLSIYRMLSNCHQFLNVFLNLNKNFIK